MLVINFANLLVCLSARHLSAKKSACHLSACLLIFSLLIFLYSDGVSPVTFLNTVTKLLRDLNPNSPAMASMVRLP